MDYPQGNTHTCHTYMHKHADTHTQLHIPHIYTHLCHVTGLSMCVWLCMHHGSSLTGRTQEHLAEKCPRSHITLYVHCTAHVSIDVSLHALTSVCSEPLQWEASEPWVTFKDKLKHTHRQTLTHTTRNTHTLTCVCFPTPPLRHIHTHAATSSTPTPSQHVLPSRRWVCCTSVCRWLRCWRPKVPE